jgi:hypothetical protein
MFVALRVAEIAGKRLLAVFEGKDRGVDKHAAAEKAS